MFGGVIQQLKPDMYLRVIFTSNGFARIESMTLYALDVIKV